MEISVTQAAYGVPLEEAKAMVSKSQPKQKKKRGRPAMTIEEKKLAGELRKRMAQMDNDAGTSSTPTSASSAISPGTSSQCASFRTVRIVSSKVPVVVYAEKLCVSPNFSLKNWFVNNGHTDPENGRIYAKMDGVEISFRNAEFSLYDFIGEKPGFDLVIGMKRNKALEFDD
jgi:hypothetical protein